MNDICFTIQLTPLATPRPRVSKKGYAYYPEKYSEYKKLLKQECEELFKDFKIIDRIQPVRMHVNFFMPIPNSFSKNKKIEMEYDWHVKKPDTDNLVKGVKDALEGLDYVNDSQVCDGNIRKIYSKEPKIEVIIEIIKEKYE